MRLLFILALLSCAACSAKRQAIVYTTAESYFVKNTVLDTNQFQLQMTAQVEFDSVFAPAAVMGLNNKLTPIDFNIQWASALVLKTNAFAQTIQINRVVYKGNTIRIAYSIQQSKTAQTYSSRACKILLFEPYYKAYKIHWVNSKA